jgi:hypothetical protein
MLAQIRKHKSRCAAMLLGIGASLFVSCASQREQVALVKDPDDKPDTMIPWNKQEKWETQNQLGGITDRR